MQAYTHVWSWETFQGIETETSVLCDDRTFNLQREGGREIGGRGRGRGREREIGGRERERERERESNYSESGCNNKYLTDSAASLHFSLAMSSGSP